MEAESLKERLQRQTDIAARAEAALTQLAHSGQQAQNGLAQQVEQLQAEVAALKRAKQEVEVGRGPHGWGSRAGGLGGLRLRDRCPLVCVCACVCACVRVCARACVRSRVCALARVCARAAD